VHESGLLRHSRRNWADLVTSAADIATLVLAAIAAGLFVTGAYRGVIGGAAVSIPWMHAAFAGVAVSAIRHAVRPFPSLRATLTSWSAAFKARPALVDAAIAFWLTRPVILLVAFLAVATIGTAQGVHGPSVSPDPLSSLASRWDAQWYAGIALSGYEWEATFKRQQNLAFFPAYPLLIRAAGALTGVFRRGVPYERQIARLAWCGVAISCIAFFWALWYLARLARELIGDTRARDAVLLLAAYPFACFFSAGYTEAGFLLASLGTWYHFRREQWAPAIMWGLVCGLFRPNGCVLSIPLALIALGVRDGKQTDRSSLSRADLAWRLGVAMMPVAGMLLFTLYLYQITGVWFAWSRMHAAWGRVFGGQFAIGPFLALRTGGLLNLAAEHPYETINGLGLIFTVGLVQPVWRLLGPAWTVFIVLNLLAPLAAGGLLSIGRLTSTLFPMFLALAGRLPSRNVPAVTAIFGILQGLFTALFYTWRDVY
jgi:hypothetical protein